MLLSTLTLHLMAKMSRSEFILRSEQCGFVLNVEITYIGRLVWRDDRVLHLESRYHLWKNLSTVEARVSSSLGCFWLFGLSSV